MNINKYKKIVKTFVIQYVKQNKINFWYQDKKSPEENLYQFYQTVSAHSTDWGNTTRPEAALEKKYGNFLKIIHQSDHPINVYVDYGGGDGQITDKFARCLTNTPQVYNIDVADYTSLQTIPITFIQNTDPNLLIEQLLKMPSVDLITMVHSLHHTKYPDLTPEESRTLVIDSLTKKVKPGSLLLVREHDVVDQTTHVNVLVMHLIYEIVELKNRDLSRGEFINFIRNYETQHQGWYFSREYLKTLLSNLGWRSIEYYQRDYLNSARVYTELYTMTIV